MKEANLTDSKLSENEICINMGKRYYFDSGGYLPILIANPMFHVYILIRDEIALIK